MDTLAITISSAALAFSIFTYLKHDKKIKQQSSLLNKYHLEKIEKEKEEEKKAIIEANVISGQNGSRIVKVYNKGKSIAKNLNVKIPQNDSYHIFINPCPIDVRPQNGIDIRLGALTENHPDKIEIEFEWSDDYSKHNNGKQMIQI
ncbi:hypothetical protein [Acetobacteroides hydrogenigenes]|uniref:Uncharacterized protein n=1 Tax=Acetobacteroides hydrogenigenes TaxID=979970 RepID=A0A4R2EYK6_9BACT|nr:hypothetical protein [Acetobacteroides hydrogenigenes]TCN72054.1 hypothetical protein CLV25_10212 [Acetobacteroides hydrogenigenes]